MMQKRAAALLLALVAANAASVAGPLETIDAMAALQAEARQAQQRIDAIQQRVERARAETHGIATSGSADALRVREVESQIADLERTIADFDADLRAVADSQSGIVTLLVAMIDALERFVQLDLPFRQAERLRQLEMLRAEIGASDTAIAGKYQAVVAAYQREIDHGMTTEVYRATVATTQGARVADVLRHGRVGLWYLSPDGVYAGRYDKATQTWIDAGVSPAAVRHAIAIVQGQAAPVPAVLPVGLELR